MTLTQLILLAASLRATTYGYHEMACGDVGHPRPCSFGAVTSSGETFDPDLPSAAVPVPADQYVPAHYIGLKVPGGKCRRIRLNDKTSPKWVGDRGFDLSPAAVKLLTGQPARPIWSGKVALCKLTGSMDSSFYPWLSRWPLASGLSGWQSQPRQLPQGVVWNMFRTKRKRIQNAGTSPCSLGYSRTARSCLGGRHIKSQKSMHSPSSTPVHKAPPRKTTGGTRSTNARYQTVKSRRPTN